MRTLTILALILCLSVIAVPCSAVINGDFESGLAGWTPVHPYDATWDTLALGSGHVLWIYTHSFMTQPDWLVNATTYAAGTYDITWSAQGYGFGNTYTSVSIGNAVAAVQLPINRTWNTYQTRLTTDGGAFRFGIFTSLDLITQADNISVAAVPEPSSLLCLGMGLCGVFGYARRRITNQS